MSKRQLNVQVPELEAGVALALFLSQKLTVPLTIGLLPSTSGLALAFLLGWIGCQPLRLFPLAPAGEPELASVLDLGGIGGPGNGSTAERRWTASLGYFGLGSGRGLLLNLKRAFVAAKVEGAAAADGST
jgi:hypothetical protein